MIKYIFLALLIGGLAGYVNDNSGMRAYNTWVSDWLFSASLYALLFIMGLAFGLDKTAFARFRRAGPRILVVPFAVACGSILGGLIGGLILGLNVVRSMAVSAGYGWYTLAGPLVGQLFHGEWLAWGFAVNFLRELLTFAVIPALAKVDRYAPVAAGGATAMDTTLPAIVKYSGGDVLITAFSSGFVLSVLAPFTIIAIASLA